MPTGAEHEMKIELREPRGQEELEAYYCLRWKILREPWTQLRETGRDEHEEGAIHLTAWMGKKLVGVGRAHFNSPSEAQIRYMAVEPDYAHHGIGSLILAELEAGVKAAGAESVVLNARDTAVGFYRKHHYKITKQSELLFNSIPHWEMKKLL